MDKILLQPTPLAHWYALVNEAEVELMVELGEDVESYLVFLLMRFTDQPQISNSIMAMDFLESLHATGRHRSNKLQEVGDKCLLYSGFFAEQAQRRRVSADYYIDLGQNAYYALASMSSEQSADLYSNLCENFVDMSGILKAMRLEPPTECVSMVSQATILTQTRH